jgi:hypothetical protein
MAKLEYKILLNGVELTDVTIGVSAIDKFEEPLDEAGINLPFTAIDYPYEMRGLLTIQVQQTGNTSLQFDYLIIDDNVSEGSKYNEWIHALSVLEYTHKLDMYLVHSLAFTKSLKNDNPAPMRVIDNIFNLESALYTPNGALLHASFEPLDIKTSYYADETITFPQVREVYQVTSNADAWNDYVERPAYITAKDLDDTTIHASEEISAGDVEWTFDVGQYYIDYSFDATSYTGGADEGDTVVYRYYITVIERNTLSVYDLIDNVRKHISKFGGIESKRYFDDTRIFEIDSDIETYLKSVEAPQTYIQKATARQVLNSVFTYVNAISRLQYQEDDLDLLTADFFNEIEGSFTVEDVSSYGIRQNARNLSSKGINWLERVMPNNLEEPTIKSPAQDNFRTVRATNIQITDTTFELKLERPLYMIKKFEVYLGDMYYDFASVGDPMETVTYEDFTLDLTARLINKEEWDLKLITVNFPTVELQPFLSEDIGIRENKVANLYWQRGQTSIKLADPYGAIVQENLVANVIEEALYEYFTRNPPEPIFSGPTAEDDKMAIKNSIRNGTTTLEIPDFDELRFNIEYITLENLNTETNREDLSFSKYYSESRLNQNDKLLNVSRAVRKSYGDLQRAGVPDITFVRHHETLDSLLTVGLRDTDGFVIIQRKLEFYNEHITATYVATKDHNRLSQFIGLDQAYRWSEIPTSNQVFERIELYNDYLVVANPDETGVSDDTIQKFYSDNAVDVIFKTLINDTDKEHTQATLAYVRTDGFLEEYPDDVFYGYYAVMTPVASFGVKGGFSFTFGFENNQVAGDGVTTSTSGGSTLYWNNAVRYTDTDGRFSELWFQISSKYSVGLSSTNWGDTSRLRNYPLIRTDVGDRFGDLSDIYYRCGGADDSGVSYDPLIIEKDSSQSIKISYQNSVLSYEYLEYVFGQKFYSENNIVKNPKVEYNEVVGTPMYLYIYDDGTTYGKFDDLRVKSGYDSSTLLEEGTNVTWSSNELEFTAPIDLSEATSWAIGDSDGNLYMACNSNHAGFKVYKKHFRPDLLEIGKTE